MFGIRSLSAKAQADPLQSQRTATAWFAQLPSIDVIARAEQVALALDALRQSDVTIDRDRVAAIASLDAATESDSRRLIAWYLKNQQKSPSVAERFWRAAHDLNKAFVQAYQRAVDAARLNEEDPRWMAVLPLLIAELIRCHGVDAKLRLFHRQRWIPAKWVQLHALFRRATDLGIERIAAVPDTHEPLAPERTIEQEYIGVLLLHRLDTGNLNPRELDWACAEIVAMSGDLTLDAVAWSDDGFYVDLEGSSGLVRRRGSDRGITVAYLDTTKLAQRLEATMREALHAPLPADDEDEEVADRQQRIVMLEKMRPAIIPGRNTDFRRHRRVPVDLAATVSTGLVAICGAIAESGRAESDEANRVAPAAASSPASSRAFASLRYDEASLREPPPWTAPARSTAPPSGGHEAAAAPTAAVPVARATSAAAPSPWRLRDMSEAGWRMTSTVPRKGLQDLALGTLVAARLPAGRHWMLGVVRRVNEARAGEIEAGASLIADRVVAVSLHAQRHATAETSFVVNGVDTGIMGARFHGLYLLPPSSGVSVSMRTLIIPTTEFAEGRRLVLVTGRSDYMVVLRHLVDRQLEWSWVTMQIVSRMQRES